MKICGEETKFKPLTVGDLRKFLNDRAAWDPGIDTNLVHWLRMEGDDDGAHTGYATHVDVDCFDTDTGDNDERRGEFKPINVVALYHWPGKDKP